MKTEYEYKSECICETECRGFVNVKCKLKKSKITAVEYLIQEFSKGLDINFNRRTNHIIEQAKEMEKEQQGYSKDEVLDIMAITWIRCVGSDGNNFKELRDEILEQFKKK